MKEVNYTTYESIDGKIFNSKTKCIEHDVKTQEFWSVLETKIGKFNPQELLLGGHAKLDSLPFTAPWMSAYGSCLIKVTDVKRGEDGKLLFQLADENNTPYDDGSVWRKAEAFYEEWPK